MSFPCITSNHWKVLLLYHHYFYMCVSIHRCWISWTELLKLSLCMYQIWMLNIWSSTLWGSHIFKQCGKQNCGDLRIISKIHGICSIHKNFKKWKINSSVINYIYTYINTYICICVSFFSFYKENKVVKVNGSFSCLLNDAIKGKNRHKSWARQLQEPYHRNYSCRNKSMPIIRK